MPRPFARHPGGILDVDVALAAMALTGAERKRLRSIWADALAKAQPELEAAREKWLEARGGEIAKARNVEPKEGRRIAEREAARFEAGELRDDFPIHLDSGEWVTVYQILSDPNRYEGARCWSLDETVSRPGVGFIQPYPSRPDPSCRQAARSLAPQFRAWRAVFQAAFGQGRNRAHRAAASRATAAGLRQGISTMNGADDEAARHAFEGRRRLRMALRRIMPKLASAKAMATVLLLTISMKTIPCTVWSSGRRPIPARLSRLKFSSH